MTEQTEQTEQTATERYFDALLASYEALHSAVEQANERGLRLSRQLAADITEAQRRAIELGRQVAANPNDAAAAYSAVMESAVAAQSHALDFTQSAYKEALAASAEGREALDTLLASSRTAAEAAMAISREWQTGNPWSEFVQKSMESFGINTNGASEQKEEATARS